MFPALPRFLLKLSLSNRFTRTLQDLNNLKDSDYIKSKKFSDFTINDLKKISSDDLRHLYQKKINEYFKRCVKTTEQLPGEEVIQLEQSEVKNMIKKLDNFRDECSKNGLSVREFEEEAINFITDKYKRYFFNSKWAQRLYKLNNFAASMGISFWGYRAVTALGTTNEYSLKPTLMDSAIPIAYFTGITFKFWSYITKPFPTVSKTLDGLSTIAMSPI